MQNQTESWIKKLKIQLEELPTTEDQGTKRKKAKIKQQIRTYYEKRIYENIKIVTGKIKTVTLPQIEVPEKNHSKIINNPDEIAERIRDHNIQHFAQAQGCKLTETKFHDITDKDQFNQADIDPDSALWKIREEINRIEVETDSLEI